VTPHATIEIRNSTGALIYSHDVNGPPQVQAIPADKVAEMNNIMTHVVTEGTGRAAQIPGLVISGKTGTTNNSTNAWFNGFTGNLVCSVWFGNDDNSGMQKMTGGTLPAESWRQIMAYAHQGLETKPPFGVAAPAPGAVAQIAAAPVAKTSGGIIELTPRPVGLAPRSTQIILEIGELARSARSRLATSDPPIAGSTQANAGPTVIRGGVLAPDLPCSPGARRRRR
jgi:penicillin-binding protein 1A